MEAKIFDTKMKRLLWDFSRAVTGVSYHKLPQIIAPGSPPFFHSDKVLLLIKGWQLLCQWKAIPKCNGC